jgi:hypothetical protein
MSDKYILDGRNPVKADDLLAWGKWMQSANRKVAYDVPFPGIRVSTVFLGLDHAFGGIGPILFETMVFGGPLDQEQERYSTWEEAEAGHAAILERVKVAGDVAL